MDDNKSTEYNRICENNIEKLVQHFVIIILLVILGHLLIIFGPIYAYIFKNIRSTPMATHLPFLEKDSDIEFTMNLLIQSVIATSALIGNISIELLTLLISNGITIIPRLIHLNLNDLVKEITGSNFNSKVRWHNVLIQVQDFDRYLFCHLKKSFPNCKLNRFNSRIFSE